MDFFLDMRSEDRPRELEKFKQPIKDMLTIMGEIMQKNPTTVAEFVGEYITSCSDGNLHWTAYPF